MLNEHRWNLTSLARGLALAVAIGVAGTASVSMAAPEKKDAAKKDEVKTDQIELIFRSGKTVKGTLVSETDTTIRVKVNIAGIIAETTYEKADILSITRNLPVPTESKPTSQDSKADKPADESKDGVKGEVIADDGREKIYMATFTGEFTRDVSRTPVKQLIDDIRSVQPDILIVKFDMSFSHYGEESKDYDPAAFQYDMLETAREVLTYFTEGLMRDPSYTKKPRMVGWVKKAMGGAAFLPLIFPELYYTSDARHGGIGYLEHMFDGSGDYRAREKQYSLRLGRAEGLAALGGYDPRIVRAMSRTDYVLSYRLEGGKPVYIEGMPTGPSEFLLTDDGKGENQDTMPDFLRFKANDVLMLDAVTAQRLGISRGTADTQDQLLLAMGFTREYNLTTGNSKKIFSDWSANVGKAEQEVGRLMREYQRVEVRAPGGFKERTEARGQQKRFLLGIKGQLDRFGEAINPRVIRGMPDQFLSQIDIAIYNIEQQQRLDRPDR